MQHTDLHIPQDQRGFTLIEVIVATTLLLGVVLGMATTTGRLVHTAAESNVRAAATQLAQDRIQQIQMDPDYASLELTYAGSEGDFATLPGFTRVTQVTSMGGSLQVWKVTVTVTGPGLPKPVARSTSIAAP